ncbi:MAG: Gfo/Idh/MocA family oxidoreductase [Verrucomicrobia bacterium]|nr:Gfo/Idh/MocA family oxidoreductase [Verrucomicrobiota bacterium]
MMGRRRFLGTTLAAGATAAVPNFLPARALGAAASADKLNLAVIGVGGRGHGNLLPDLLQLDAHCNVVALCDVDTAAISNAKAYVAKNVENSADASARFKIYDDYRKLLDQEKSLDGVVIAVGNRWHVPMSKAFMKAGKHVYCEKPLGLSISELRELRELTRTTKNVVTQIGAQGAAGDGFRRSIEIIQAGVLGQVREVHCWTTRECQPSQNRPAGEDPVPTGLNWDFWLGQSPYRPYKQGIYTGGLSNWCRWFDFGDGTVADMGIHSFNLAVRALELESPTRVEAQNPEPVLETYVSKGRFRFDFAARGKRAAVSLFWYDGKDALPPSEVTQGLLSTYKSVPEHGCVYLAEKGILWTDPWGQGGCLRLAGEAKLRGVLDHEACKLVPVTLPRVADQNHMAEWLRACKLGTGTFSDFDIGGRVTEICLTGTLALRLGRPIEYDGGAMKVIGAPEADMLIRRPQRTQWFL